MKNFLCISKWMANNKLARIRIAVIKEILTADFIKGTINQWDLWFRMTKKNGYGKYFIRIYVHSDEKTPSGIPIRLGRDWKKALKDIVCCVDCAHSSILIDSAIDSIDVKVIQFITW